MESRNLTSTDVKEILSIRNDEMVSLDSFCARMLCLGKTHEEVNLINGQLSSLPYADQKQYYEKEFIKAIEGVYVKLNTFSQASAELAIGLYNLKNITNSTHDEISRQMSIAYNKKISKSYLSKLINAGRILNDFPDLKNIQDIEKLALISSLSNLELESYLNCKGDRSFIRELDLDGASRSKLKSAIDEIKVENGRSVKKCISENILLPSPFVTVHEPAQPGRFEEIVRTLESVAMSIHDKPKVHKGLLECIKMLKEEMN